MTETIIGSGSVILGGYAPEKPLMGRVIYSLGGYAFISSPVYIKKSDPYGVYSGFSGYSGYTENYNPYCGYGFAGYAGIGSVSYGYF